jgi:L-alanine-DL-glutamate epimerase-like enolase superfamily enzyme
MIAPHTVPELHGHLVAAFPRCGFCVESHGDTHRNPLAHELYREHAQVRDSQLHLGDKPGFGIEIDWGFVDKHRAS